MPRRSIQRGNHDGRDLTTQRSEEPMATQQAKSIGKTDYAPPPVEGDFYRIAAVLNDSERALLKRVRDFTEGVVAPVIEDYWSRDAFPFEIIPRMAEVGIGGVGYQGYGTAGGSWLLNGLVSMELARVDASVATFWGVHTGLSAGSIYLCGDEQKKQRWLPPMMRFDKIGSFGLTEPQAATDLAELLLKQDRVAEACRHLSAALDRMPAGILSPDHSRALQVLNQLRSGS
jgi:alkylation response protein AidB-like acyl-CoA dehydrogenase